MIVGIGVDIVDVRRIRRDVERYGDRFARRVLGADELLEYARSSAKPRFLAKRFAAKEAFVKALGTGFRDGLTLRQIAIGHDALGKPFVICSGRVEEALRARGATLGHLSMSDEREYSLAIAILETGRA
jgi:holo-[acyl-carrier protein] synthase